jgi:spore maturation protein CgeB
MKLVLFGLTISSSWGNGHATLWRGLIRALSRQGHSVVFFEKDVPYYAQHRDLHSMPGANLRFYSDWTEIAEIAARELSDADVGMVTSYCPDGVSASELVLGSNAALRVFYDLDTPVTLNHLQAGESVAYIGPRGLGDFDLVLSYTGGRALDMLRSELGARNVAPLYGSVDPDEHRPVAPVPNFECHCSYLGTYAGDRQQALEELFIEPARRLPGKKFLIGGAMYPDRFPWADNIYFVRHVPPSEHSAFYCSSTLTLNVTRGAMAKMGYCPSGRLFEAAACGVPILSDYWEGLEHFFTPGKQILVANDCAGAVAALCLDKAELRKVAASARERTLSEHTASRRAAELVRLLEGAASKRTMEFA